jgi:hypothetical protein
VSIENQRELTTTREKLRQLEEKYEALRQQPAPDKHVRELTLRSLKKLMNQLREEIVRFETRMSSRPK